MMLGRLLLLALALLLTACSKEPFYQEQAYVFGTQVDVSIYGEDEARARQATIAVMHEFQRLHDMLHAWKPSELSSLNAAIAQGKHMQVSPELAEMLKDAALVSAQSDGLFNPAIGKLIQTWGFQAEDFQAVLPDAKKVAALVKTNPQMSDLRSLEPYSSKLPVPVYSRNRSVKLDLGGYAKGYALDRAASILKEQGIHNALINIGGNVMALGTRGSRPWTVGIQHPRKPGPLAILELRDGEAVGTSGDYQRYFELDGKRYCHLIDPRSGYPVQDVQAVTILTRGEHAGLRSDSNSKPLFISRAQGWLDAVRKMQLEEALLIDGQGMVHLTAAMQKRLKFTDESTRREVAP
ncbi:MAG: FAD:protein FMN transferase [Nitrosomonadales bacterium]|nr:FAD:protein FMN transferase [Nitrosomonadales bacterium]